MATIMWILAACVLVPVWSAVSSRAEREACPYWKAIGTLSDHMELSCGGERANVLSPTERESVALACCPEPYNRCEPKDRIAGCDKLIIPFLKAPGSTASKQAWSTAVQKARGALVAADAKCSSILAPELPHATCKGENIAGRDDIYCEMMLFQTEQLGDGNPEEYAQLKCPFPGQAVQDAAKKKASKFKRKLKKSQVPKIWQSPVAEL